MDTITVNKFECVSAQGRWADENGSPIDITGRTMSIIEARPAELKAGTVTITNAENGEFEILIPSSIAAKMGVGRVNWIRLAMSMGANCLDTTPMIWIDVQ